MEQKAEFLFTPKSDINNGKRRYPLVDLDQVSTMVRHSDTMS